MASDHTAGGARRLRKVFLAERYSAGISIQSARHASEAARIAAIQLSLEGRDVTLIGSLLVPTDETVYSLFGAAAVNDVVAVGERASLPYDRITESVPIARASRTRRAREGGEPRAAMDSPPMRSSAGAGSSGLG